MRRAAIFLSALSLQVASINCGPTHTGPSEGFIVYEHPNYGGDSLALIYYISDLKDIQGPCNEYTDSFGVETGGDWNDCISSIRVSPGWAGTIFKHDDYLGGYLTVTSDIQDLEHVSGPCGDDWENCITSIRVTRP